MSSSAFLWILSIFWLIAYVVRANNRTQDAVLPLTTRPSPTKSRQWTVTLKGFHLKLATTAFNAKHDALSEHLDRLAAKSVARVCYDIGSFVGVLGTISGLCILGMTCGQVLSVVLSQPQELGESLVKRDTTGYGDAMSGHRAFAVHALVHILSHLHYLENLTLFIQIPGVTVPFSHMPIMLLALFVAQCVHELGHAVAAAM